MESAQDWLAVRHRGGKVHGFGIEVTGKHVLSESLPQGERPVDASFRRVLQGAKRGHVVESGLKIMGGGAARRVRSHAELCAGPSCLIRLDKPECDTTSLICRTARGETTAERFALTTADTLMNKTAHRTSASVCRATPVRSNGRAR